MSGHASWLARETAAAPPVLAARVHACFNAAGHGAETALPVALAEAGRATLARVEQLSSDRAAALDLLAADGLITLALLAQAEAAPADLERFATTLLTGGAANS